MVCCSSSFGGRDRERGGVVEDPKHDLEQIRHACSTRRRSAGKLLIKRRKLETQRDSVGNRYGVEDANGQTRKEFACCIE